MEIRYNIKMFIISDFDRNRYNRYLPKHLLDILLNFTHSGRKLNTK